MPLDRSRHRLAACVVLLGATGAAFAGPSATRSAVELGKGPVRCELDITRRGGSVELTALVHADKAMRGEYAFAVSGRGSDIRQGGPFQVAAGGTERLGTVTLGGARYDADLRIVVDGRTIRCLNPAGGPI